ISTDNKEYSIWHDDGSHIFETVAATGKHAITIKVVDMAGNYREQTATFSVELPKPPQFTGYSEMLGPDELLFARGVTRYPETDVTVWLRSENNAARFYTVKADPQGNFEFSLPKPLAGGTYQMWTVATNRWGVKSEASPPVIIRAKSSPFPAVRVVFGIIFALLLIGPLVY